MDWLSFFAGISSIVVLSLIGALIGAGKKKDDFGIIQEAIKTISDEKISLVSREISIRETLSNVERLKQEVASLKANYKHIEMLILEMMKHDVEAMKKESPISLDDYKDRMKDQPK